MYILGVLHLSGSLRRLPYFKAFFTDPLNAFSLNLVMGDIVVDMPQGLLFERDGTNMLSWRL